MLYICTRLWKTKIQTTHGGFDLDNRRSSVVYKSYKRLASRGSFFALTNTVFLSGK